MNVSRSALPSVPSMGVDIDPERRRRLLRIVIAVVAACGVILLAALIARIVRGSGNAGTAATAAKPTYLASPATPASAPPPHAPGDMETPAGVASGTLRIDRPALMGRVWLDGNKLSAASSPVSCGQHTLKVGTRGYTHTVEVPCGGELHVAR